MDSQVYQKKKVGTTGKNRAAASIKHSIDESLARSAGTGNMQNRDPIYHITDHFKTTFDLCGQRIAAKMAGVDHFSGSSEQIWGYGRGSEESKADEYSPGQEKPAQEIEQGIVTGPMEFAQESGEAQRGFYGRFSDIAFRNGHLASAVLQNGGKTMFVSCAKRALGQTQARTLQHSKLFSATSEQEPMHDPAAKAVLEQYAKGAVGLVVESIHSARNTLEFFEQWSKEEPALQRIYPFLNISEDQERLAHYEEKLKNLSALGQTNDVETRKEVKEQKAVLVAGMTKTQALITKKRQMKEQFFYLLEHLLEKSKEAEAIFAEPAFPAEVAEELLEVVGAPPEDNPEDDQGEQPEDLSGEAEE